MADQGSFIKMSVYYGEDQVTVTSGSISTVGERIIMRGDHFDLIPHKSIVDVIGYLQDGVVFMSGKVTLSTESQINFDIIETNDKQERRNYLKVKVQMKTKLLRAFSMGKSNKSYLIGETIQMRDLSLGGIGFYSNRVLLRKQKITIDFTELKPGFIARAEILRREKGPFRGGYRYKYGCRFLDISGEAERVLCEFVFRTQLENHRKLMRLEEDLD